uniref:Protein kinase domain-containing protein n=1 Tax=Lactuca sativa TaxID=4236 RepID=A0A9R1XL35_LACSA|nr:hypothetical protein LSAT_V11C300112110 [Lactuca sativa]
MQLPGLLFSQLISRPHFRQPPNPLLHLDLPFKIRGENRQFVQRPRQIRKQRKNLINSHHIQLKRIHHRDKILHTFRHKITESVVRNFTRHILSGLAYLHSKKTVHRDIKGANLLVDASGVVKVADFGLAKHVS